MAVIETAQLDSFRKVTGGHIDLVTLSESKTKNVATFWTVSSFRNHVKARSCTFHRWDAAQTCFNRAKTALREHSALEAEQVIVEALFDDHGAKYREWT